MPIRINLLAEAIAAEELRRKDPVKRAVVAAILLVVAALCWSSTLQFKIMAARSELSGIDSKWKGIENNYQKVVENRRKAIETEERLASLQNYTTNRFLWGSMLNAFQQTLNGVEDIQVVRLKGEQNYTLSDESKAAKDPKSGAAKVPTATEKINFTIEALDFSPQAGGQVNRFKEAIATVPYFQSSLLKTNGVLLTSLSAPQLGPASHNPYVMFNLQCFFPEKVRR